MAGLPAARGPAVPRGRVRRRPVVPAGARARGPGPAEPPSGVRGPCGRRTWHAARPRGRDRPARARTARPLRVPPQRPLLPGGRPHAGRHPAVDGRAPGARYPRARSPRRSCPARPSCSSGCTSARWSCAVLFLAFRVGTTVTPMETIDDPGLQAWFERTRGVSGVQLVGLREARRVLQDALANGTPVGLVGDRDLTGGGIPIPLFGAPATLPMGPAMLAVESGVPVYGMGVRRSGHGHYRGRLVPVDGPGGGHATRARHGDDDRARRLVRAARRGRARAVVGGLLPDLAGPGGGRGAWTPSPARRARRARRPAHPHVASDGTASVTSVLERAVEPRPRRHRHHGPRAHRCRRRRPGDRAGSRPAGRGHRRRGGHDPRRPPAGAGPDAPVKSYRSMRDDDRGDPRPGRPGDPGPPAGALPAVRPGPDAARPARRRRSGGPARTPSRRSTRRRSDGRATRRSSASRPTTAWPRSATATPTRSTRSGSAGRRSRATPRTTCARPSPPARPAITATFHETLGQLGTFRDQLRKRGRDARDEALGRVRQDGTGRDHGYPGGRQRPPRFDAGTTGGAP